MSTKKDPPYIRTEYELEAVFKHRRGGETVFKDIVGMSATFALNTIPTASLEVATGLEVHTEKFATIHDVIDTLEPRDRCVVYLTIRSTAGLKEDPITSGMYDGKMIVFDGYYAGIGYRRGDSMCAYTIHLIHWLDDLNCSSMLNGDWSPGTPNDLAQCASQIVLSYLTGGGGAGEDTSAGRSLEDAIGVPLVDHKYPGDDNVIVTVDNMEEDLWEKIIKRTFEAICSLRHPVTQCGDLVTSGVDEPPEQAPGAEPLLEPGKNNRAAWEALQRMPGDQLPEKYKAKLPLNLTGYGEGEPFAFLSLAAHKGIQQALMQGIGYNTFWSKLVGELAPSFMFAISPSVTFAQAIPFFPGLNTPYVTITGEEYNYANFATNCAHMISSVVIKWPPQTDLPTTQGDMGAILGFCQPPGFYPKNEQDYRHHWGNILIREPPIWLANPVYAESYTRENNSNTEGRSAFAPQRGSEKNPEAPLTPQEIEKAIKDNVADVDGQPLTIYDRFACHWYKSAILGQRFGELSGKLRFDIAPGSIVKIEPPITAINKENTDMYGAVVQVSFGINAEQHTAGTSFSFSHVRTHKENDITNADSKIHYVGTVAPLYKNAQPGAPWPGGPLVIGQQPGGNSGANAQTDIGAPAFGGVGTGIA